MNDRRRLPALAGGLHVRANPRSDRESVRHLARGAHSVAVAVVPARRAAALRVARDAHRLARDPRPRPVGLENAARRGCARLSLRLRHRRVERRLDHFLGSDAVQHAGDDRVVRQAATLARAAGNPRRAGANHPVRLGLRRAARGIGRLRLPLGFRRAHSDRARHSRSRRHPGCRHRQQRAGLLRRARRPDHRARYGDRGHARYVVFGAAADLLGLGRQDRRHPRFVAAVDPSLSRVRQQRHVVGLAARDRRLARLYRRTIADRRLSRALSARCRRRDRLLRSPAAAAQGLAAGAGHGLWRPASRRRHAERRRMD